MNKAEEIGQLKAQGKVSEINAMFDMKDPDGSKASEGINKDKLQNFNSMYNAGRANGENLYNELNGQKLGSNVDTSMLEQKWGIKDGNLINLKTGEVIAKEGEFKHLGNNIFETKKGEKYFTGSKGKFNILNQEMVINGQLPY